LIILQSLHTKIAFDGGFLVIIILHGPEGTGLQTFFAPNAQVFIYQNEAHFIRRDSFYRASLLAWCLGTMVAIDWKIIR
jgi:hypothetical protein